MNKTVISVCIATYNGQKYISQQIGSILPQLGECDEIVISDDNSTDDTIKNLSSLNDGRIKIFVNTGTHGVTGNFENAIKHASGEYIFLSDQDDVWLPNKTEIFMRAFRSGADVVLSDCYFTDSELNIAKGQTKFESYGVHTDFLRTLIRCDWQGSCMAFRSKLRTYFLPIPKSKYILHDIWIGITIGLRTKLSVLTTPTMLYRRHEDTVTPWGLGTAGEKVHSVNPISFKVAKRVAILYYYACWRAANLLKRNKSTH